MDSHREDFHVEKKRNFAEVSWGVLAGIAVLVGGSLLSWRMAPHSELSGAQIHVPKPESLGIVLPREPVQPAAAVPTALENRPKPVKIKRLRSPSSERLMQEGLVPPPEEVQRMKKKGVVSY